MKKSRIVIITIIITMAVLFVFGKVFNTSNRLADKGLIVRIEQPRRGDLIEYVSAPGDIEPKTKVSISAKVMARITELPYDEGDVVTCGRPDANPPVPASVLVKLDAKDLESQLRSAEAGRAAQAAEFEVEKARIASQRSSIDGLTEALKQAERDLNRKKGLFETKDISQSDLDQAQYKFNEQKAQYEAAQQTLKAVELNQVVMEHNLEAADARVTQAKEALNYTTITSPIDGVITSLNAVVGELVVTGTMNNPGTVILEVADLSKMLLVAQVDEADIGKIKIGQPAMVYVQAFSDRKFKGVVDSIALKHTMSRSQTKYFKTEILLENSEKQLYSGLTAHVDIETQRHTGALKLPSQAVLGRTVDELPVEIRKNCPDVDPNKTFATVVYRYVEDKAVVTPVKIGPSDLTDTIILSGMTEDDRIIVGPYKVLEGLKHNQKVSDERNTKDGAGKAGNQAGNKEPNSADRNSDGQKK